MPKSLSFFVRSIPPAIVSIACLAIGGCERVDQITTYSVPKHASLQTPQYLADEAARRQMADEEARRSQPIPKRMIGVIIPKEPSFWVLKLDGNIDAVAARESDVREFLKTLRFSQAEDSEPAMLEWKLPNGWRQLPGNEFRTATLALDGQPPLEMSVSKLPIQRDQEVSDQVLGNINRWRGQLSLPPIEKDQMDANAEKLSLNGFVAYWISLEGLSKPNPARDVPGHASTTTTRETKKKPKVESDSETPRYDKPAEWKDAGPTPFAKISLLAGDGDAQVKITATQARGTREQNVNRWRDQLKLNHLPEAEIAAASQKVAVGDGSGDLYEMSNDGQTILGVIIEDPEQTWFVKLHGDSRLAERERPRFVAFLKSLHLGKGR